MCENFMKLSIIVPVYNTEKYLNKCIASILCSDCTDCEVIIIDDGSNDGVTPAVCDGIAQEHSATVRVVHQENMGLGGARNTGIALARGEYLLFVDSDDYVDVNAVKILKNAIAESGNADIISFGIATEDENGSITPHLPVGCPENRCFKLSQAPNFLFSSLPSACNKAFRRALFVENGLLFPTHVWYEDIRTTTKLAAVAKSHYAIKDCLYFYFQRSDSIMHSGNTERNREIIDAFNDIINWFKSNNLFNQYRNELCMLAIEHIYLSASVRVSISDPRHSLLKEFYGYMEKEFPNYKSNPYISNLPPLKRLLIKLIDRRCYLIVKLLFKIKSF